MTRSRTPVEREIRVDDPDLSPEANRLITGELREAIGSDRAQVPAHRGHDAGRLPNSGRPTLGAALATHRVLIAITFAVLSIVTTLIVVGTVIAGVVLVGALAAVRYAESKRFRVLDFLSLSSHSY